jgi:hypothetical protein
MRKTELRVAVIGGHAMNNLPDETAALLDKMNRTATALCMAVGKGPMADTLQLLVSTACGCIQAQATALAERDKIKELLSLCKCGVSIAINEHRNLHQSVAEALEDTQNLSCPPDITHDVRAKMIETDTIVVLHFYPLTPVGFYEVWHYDLDAALDEALATVKKENKV